MTTNSVCAERRPSQSHRTQIVSGLALFGFNPARHELRFGFAGRTLLGFDQDVVSVARFLEHVGERFRAPLASAFENATTHGSDAEVTHDFWKPCGELLTVRTSLQPPGPGRNDWCSGAVEILSRSDNRVEPLADIYSALIEATSDAIILVGADSRIRSFNPAAEAMFGFTSAEVCGQPLDVLIPVAARHTHQKFFQEFLETPKTGRMMGNRPEMMGLRVNGEEFPAEVSIAHFDVNGQTLVAAIVRDISLRQQRERDLEESRRRAELASEAKSRFLAQMSHEIRTPLNGMLGMAQVLDQLVVDPDQREMIETIQESGETLLSLLNDVLDLSKISSGKLVLEDAPFLPADLARRLQSALRIKAEAKGLAFSVLVNVGAQDRRIGDTLRIMQILLNMVGNAIKFTEAGEVSVLISAERNAPLRLQVRDTGIGMPRAMVDRIFEEFEQGDTSTTRKFGGTGLGLSIVKGLVDLMQGDISVETEPGVGSTFTVALPLPEAKTFKPAEKRRLSTDKSNVLLGRHALVADDIRTNQLVICAVLDALGVTYDVVDDGLAAVQLATTTDYDFMMLDIQMPGLDGVMAFDEIRRLAAQAGRTPPPAVAVTANAMPDQVESYLESGFAACLPKPLHVGKVEETLARILSAGPHPNTDKA